VSGKEIDQENPSQLRREAVARLTGRGIAPGARANSSAALGVLYELASTPATSADALALLHELQVHQVELEMREEELLRSRAELEASLVRRIQLYDFAPFAYFTIDAATTLCELNLAAARLLGLEREALLGCRLDSYLTADGGRALNAMMMRIRGGSRMEACELEVRPDAGTPCAMRACVNADLTGGRFLVALAACGAEHYRPA
jgi:PAS domain-containing protein